LPHRRWYVHRTNQSYIEYLCKTTGISPIIAQILVNRGIKKPEEVRTFLTPSIDALEPADEIPGMDRAVQIILDAIKAGKKILVHGDYDTDGLTATAIVVKALKMLSSEAYYFIPDRFEHGYGFSEAAVDYAKALGVSLIITVDCGITSFESIEKAKAEGISVIVTDHHQPKRTSAGEPILPPALVVVNPQLRENALQYPNISGATVALKLVSKILSEEQYLRLFELACLGTIADVVPLIGDNRIVVKEGMKLINDEPSIGIQALKEVASVKKLSPTLMSFTLIPRLNASGRVDNAMQVVELLLSEEYDKAMLIAEKLNLLNQQRQKLEQEVLQQALEIVDAKGYDKCIVVGASGWHEGVVGIVASRLTEAFYRPSFVLNIHEQIAKGSARAIPEFDLYGALCKCQDLLISFGGHTQAAGLKLKAELVKVFEEQMNRIIEETLTEEQLIPMLKIDASVRLKDITNGLVNDVAALEPYGFGNPEPLLGAKSVQVCRARTVGNGHLKLLLKDEEKVMEAIGFEMGEDIKRITEGQFYDIAFSPYISEWEGMKTVQLKIQGIRQSKRD